MIVKKFQAPTETEAILKAKDELGSSAVVLNVKKLKQRGIFRLFKKDVTEVTAALEEKDFIQEIKDKKPSFSDSLKGSGNSNNTTSQTTGSLKDKTSGNSIDIVADEKINISGNETAAIEQKLESLQNLLRSQTNRDYENNIARKEMAVKHEQRNTFESAMPKSNDILRERESKNHKFLSLIHKKLIDNEVSPEYADEIIADIEKSLKKESNIDSILSAVYQKIILKLGEPDLIETGNKTNVVFFIGPTGVGKTTTIAKVASKFKLEKQAKVAFITSDTYRIAAIEQLNTYASIIDCPVSVVYSADEITKALDEYKGYDLILVDTAGRSHKATEQMEELTDLLNTVKENNSDFNIKIYLTLSITTKYRDLENITKTYSDIDGWSVIFTKLDETCTLGNILNIRLLTDAKLSYTTSGQNVPNDIEAINKQAVTKQLLGGGSV